MKSLCLIALLAAFGIIPGASADNTPNLKPFSLRLELPSDSVDCSAARASSLGSVFAAQTGLTVTSAACQGTHFIADGGTTYATVTLVIDYQAEAEVVPFQAIFGGTEFLGTPSDHSGLFAKYGDCLNARGAQEAAYTASTGLQVFAAYCDVSDESINPGYSLVIEAFGTPKAALYSFTQDSALDGVSPQVMEAAKSSISQAGGTVVLSDDSHIFYYSPYAIDVDVHDLGFFSDASQCQTQIVAAQAIFTQAKAEGISAFCVATGATGATRSTLTVVATADEQLQEDYGYTSQQYSSFSDCMSDLGRVMQNAQSNNENVLGGICKPGGDLNGLFVLDLYRTMN